MRVKRAFVLEFKLALVQMDLCPMCLGELDTGFECNDCGYDASQHLPSAEAAREAHFEEHMK